MFVIINKTIFLLIYFFLLEIKGAKTKLINLKNFIKQIKLTSYFKKKNIFKNEDLNNYLLLNSNINNKNKIKNYSTKNKIIVESLINHPHYTLSHCIVANKLREFYNIKCIGIIKEGDLVAENIRKTLDLKNFN